jgi:hypothetical protein
MATLLDEVRAVTEQLHPGARPVVPERHHDGLGDGRRDPPAGPRPPARRGRLLVTTAIRAPTRSRSNPAGAGARIQAGGQGLPPGLRVGRQLCSWPVDAHGTLRTHVRRPEAASARRPHQGLGSHRKAMHWRENALGAMMRALAGGCTPEHLAAVTGFDVETVKRLLHKPRREFNGRPPPTATRPAKTSSTGDNDRRCYVLSRCLLRCWQTSDGPLVEGGLSLGQGDAGWVCSGGSAGRSKDTPLGRGQAVLGPDPPLQIR